MNESDFDPSKIVLCWVLEPKVNKKTAQEMFEALGYHLYINNSYMICYSKFCDCLYEQITFWLKQKRYNSCFFDGEQTDLRDIEIEEHKAITQQMKELGWMEE